MERDERALEKAASALERIGVALTRIAKIMEDKYNKEYPEKRVVREATLTTVRTPAQEDLEESIQGSERTVEQWKDIGPREQEFVDKEKSKKPA